MERKQAQTNSGQSKNPLTKTFLQQQIPDVEAGLDQDFVPDDIPEKRDVGDPVDQRLQHQDGRVRV